MPERKHKNSVVVMVSTVDSLKQILDNLSEALKNKESETHTLLMLLMNFFSSLPFIIKIGSLDSCHELFTLLNLLSPITERDRITHSIQARYTLKIYEQYETEQDHELDAIDGISVESRSMVNENKNFIQPKIEDSDTLQAFIESHLDKLIDIYFSFTPDLQTQTFEQFFKLIKAYPQKFCELFPKIMEYLRENRISEEKFIPLSLFAVDITPKKIVSLICGELITLNESCDSEEIQNKLPVAHSLFRFLKETHKIYPEEYWDYLDTFIELLNSRFSSFSTNILDLLIYYARKGCGEMVAHLNTILNILDIPGIDRGSLVILLRELSELIAMPDFSIPDPARIALKINLYSRISSNFDEMSQICFDLLLNLVASTENEESDLKQILNHLIENNLADPYFWIQYLTSYNNFRLKSNKDTTIPNIDDYIPQDSLEEHESLIDRAAAFRDLWKKN